MSSEVASISEIFSTSWEEYKERALPIFAVVLISTAILFGMVIILALTAGFGGTVLIHIKADQSWIYILIALSCFLILVITILALWVHTAMLAIIVDEDLGIIEAFQRGWEYLWPMTWVLTIFSGIIVTGFIFGILPGILCCVWFSFSFYILIEEDKRGMDAILASMEYVRGNWWNTFGKLLVIWLLYIVTGLIPFVGALISLLFYPFLMLFVVTIYRDLKSISGEVEVPAGQGTRMLWWGITVIGLIVPILAVIVGLIAVISGEQGWMDLTRQSMEGIHL